jgi:hypothetical protein
MKEKLTANVKTNFIEQSLYISKSNINKRDEKANLKKDDEAYEL